MEVVSHQPILAAVAALHARMDNGAPPLAINVLRPPHAQLPMGQHSLSTIRVVVGAMCANLMKSAQRH